MNQEIKSILESYVKANKGNDFEYLVNKIAKDITDVMEKPAVHNQEIVRTWTNGFAQTCYLLEDGTVLAVSYSQDSLQTIVGSKETYDR